MQFLTAEMSRLEYDLKEFLRVIYNTKAYQRQVTYEDLKPETAYHFPGPILRRMTADYPEWSVTRSLDAILDELAAA